MPLQNSEQKSAGSGPLGFEAKLWIAADALRNKMDAAKYEQVVLEFVFLQGRDAR